MVVNPDSGGRTARTRVVSALIVCLALGLAVFGLVMLTSAGKSFKASDPRYIFNRQMIYLAFGIVFGVGAALVPLDRIRSAVWWIYGIVAVLLLAVRVPGIGRPVKGSWRWIQLPGFNLQVSDLGKLALLLAIAHYLAKNRRWFSAPRPSLLEWDWSGWLAWKFWRDWDISWRWVGVLGWLCVAPVWWVRCLRPNAYDTGWVSWRGSRWVPYLRPVDEASLDLVNGFVKPCAIIAGVCALIAIEPDLGTMVLCGAVGGTLLFLSGVRHLYVWPSVAAAFTAFAAVVLAWENRRNRVISFMYPEETKQGVGYQLWQGMRGFACGGLDGAGLSQGMQQEAFLPEAHTDFVFAIVGEELGLWFTLGVTVAFLGLFILVASHLSRQQDLFRFNLCLGAMLFIVYQALINMGVVTGLLPTKGMSLPFISYGGTNLVTMCVFVGIILNCMRTGTRLTLGGPREIP